MAKRGRTSETDSSAWLLPGVPAKDEAASNGDSASDLDQWLVPDASENGRKPNREAKNGRPQPDKKGRNDVEPRAASAPTDSTEKSKPRPARARPDRGRNPRERWIASRLRRAKERLRAQEEEIEGLKARVAELEAEAEPKLTTKPKKSSRGGTLELNSATFEQLRELGLSVTQSARLIAYRESRGGFGSLDELAEVPGVSRDAVSELSSQLTI
jgi:DNA uptake protein ComE-like DNA-binding protein